MSPASTELASCRTVFAQKVGQKERKKEKEKPLLTKAASCHTLDQGDEKVANAPHVLE